jgi:hypothetical protein
MAKAKDRVNKRNTLKLQAPVQEFFVAEFDCSGTVTACSPLSAVIASEAKQSISRHRERMDCFAEPSSGAHSRDPLARNDDESLSKAR